MDIRRNQLVGTPYGREQVNNQCTKTQNTKVHVLIDGELKECALVFTNNGSDFHLEPVKQVFRNVK